MIGAEALEEGGAIVVGRSAGEEPEPRPGATAGEGGAFVGRLGAAGELRWMRREGSKYPGTVLHAFGPRAEVALADVHLPSGKGDDPSQIVVIDREGAERWRAALPGRPAALAWGEHGTLHVAMRLETARRAPGGPCAGSKRAGCLVRFDAAGRLTGAAVVPDTDPAAIAALPGGDIVVAAHVGFARRRLGGRWIVGAPPHAAYLGAVVARLDAAGRARWVVPLRAPGGSWLVRPDAVGGVLLATEVPFAGPAAIGARAIDEVGDVLVASLDASGGVRWARRFHAGVANVVTALHGRPDGGAAIGGRFRRAACFTPVRLLGVGGDDAFVFVLDAAGRLAASGRWGGAGRDAVVGLGAASGGAVEVVVDRSFEPDDEPAVRRLEVVRPPLPLDPVAGRAALDCDDARLASPALPHDDPARRWRSGWTPSFPAPWIGDLGETPRLEPEVVWLGGCFGLAPATGTLACAHLEGAEGFARTEHWTAVDLVGPAGVKTLLLEKESHHDPRLWSVGIAGDPIGPEELRTRLAAAGVVVVPFPSPRPLAPGEWVPLGRAGSAVQIDTEGPAVRLRCPDGRVVVEEVASASFGRRAGRWSFRLQSTPSADVAAIIATWVHEESDWMQVAELAVRLDVARACGR